jgi:hypothetical protein
MAPPPVHLPNGSHRTVIIGPNGSGKTVAGAWLLSRQDWTRRPWVALDFKGEELWDQLGSPPMRRLRLGDMPGKRGLYRMEVLPGQEDEIEAWLWRVWEHENIGLFCDEVSLMPRGNAFKAILRQGRSKLVPVIACTQRPVDCDREVFTESRFRMLFGVEDTYRDFPIIRGLFGGHDVREALPPHWSYYYDAKFKHCHVLQPVPPPDTVVATLSGDLPYNWILGG